MKAWIFVLLAIGTALSWNTPTMLESRGVGLNDFYVDPFTGTHHLIVTFYYDKPVSNVYYYQLDESNKVVYSSVWNDTNVLRYYGLRIIGSGNGKNLYAVLEGTYKHGHFTDQDELFTESADGGRTWSPMIPVPRKDMNDGCQRTGQCIIQVAETGRLFIFYHVDCRIRSPVLSYVTRPPGSQVFTQEKL